MVCEPDPTAWSLDRRTNSDGKIGKTVSSSVGGGGGVGLETGVKLECCNTVQYCCGSLVSSVLGPQVPQCAPRMA